MAGIPTNRSNITLPAEVSGEVLAKTQQTSAIMRLARQIALPGRGVQIPVITSDPVAGWVDETGAKPVSNPGLSSKLMQPYKLAVIVPFSEEFFRDANALYDEIIARLPNAFGAQFDGTVIGALDAPGENFDTFANATAQSLIATENHSTYDGLVNAYTDISANGGHLNAFAMSPAGLGILIAAVDTTGRPLFVPSAASGEIGRLLGAQVIENRGLYKAGEAGVGTAPGTPAIVGVAGDWSRAVFGTVEGIKMKLLDQATLVSGTTTINLAQNDMVAVRAEIELGFRADVNSFNLLTGAVPQA